MRSGAIDDTSQIPSQKPTATLGDTITSVVVKIEIGNTLQLGTNFDLSPVKRFTASALWASEAG